MPLLTDYLPLEERMRCCTYVACLASIPAISSHVGPVGPGREPHQRCILSTQ